MTPLVIDGSTALRFLMEDEQGEQALKALGAMEGGMTTFVPVHWWLEVANALLMAERRKRASQAEIMEMLDVLHALPVITDDETTRHSGGNTVALARQYNLSVYDGAYLELAMRRGATLATDDRALSKAAIAAGVALLTV